MRNLIAGLIAGVVLGSTSAAVAVSTYWTQSGRDYSCEGTASGAICKTGRYDVGVTRSYVFVQQHGSKLTFGCRKWSGWSSCVQD